MNTKLTLTLEKEVIEKAKQYASQHERSLSEIVENYFKLLTESKSKSGTENIEELSPRIKKLKGILKVDADFDYKEVLNSEKSKKYGI